MKTLLAEIKEDELVFGSFIHHRDIGVVFSDLPTVFRIEKLATYAGHIRRFFLLGEGDGGFQGMELSYEEMLVVSRPINKAYLLVTFCSPDANSQSIHLQHKVLLPELWTAIQKQAPQQQVQQKEEVVEVEETPEPKKKQTFLFRGVSYEK